MTEIPRRKLDELEFIYKRDPARQDVFVEGPSDKAIVSWFFQENGLATVAVYTISSVDISDNDLIQAGYRASNRDRVIFLSQFIERLNIMHKACIIDSDFSWFLEEKPMSPPLFETDYSCMEMYFFNSVSISKFITICCQRDNWPVDLIINYLAEILQEMFLYRCSNNELKWGMDWLDGIVCMDINDWKILFNSEEYIHRFLHKNNKIRNKQEFVDKVESLRPFLKPDPRFQINGHDFIALLSWYIRKNKITGDKTQPGNVLNCLTMTLTAESLKNERLFNDILLHVGPNRDIG